jgi:hypothetical protein
MHSRPLEARFDDVLVGTLNHSRTDRPAVTLELRILHQSLSLAQVIQLGTHLFFLSEVIGETISHTQEWTGSPMFEHMQTALKHRVWKMAVRFP